MQNRAAWSEGVPAACEQARVHSLYLPVPLWCIVGNTEIKCRSEVGDEALSAGGRFQSLEYIPLLYSQTSCIRETPHLPAHPLAPQTGAGHRWSLSGLMFAEGCTVHTSKLQAAVVR